MRIFVALLLAALPGSLDPSWGAHGTARTRIVRGPGQVSFAVTGAALAPGGKVVVEAQHILDVGSRYFVARYTSRGRLDKGFGRGGVVALPTGKGGPLLVISSGRIVAGNVRLNLNGSVDAGFRPPARPGGWNTVVRALAAAPGGKVVEAVQLYKKHPATERFGLFRLQPNGSLDRSFGSHGGTVTAVGNQAYTRSLDAAAWPRALLRLADGSMYVAGEGGITATRGGFALLRYRANGALDDGFGDHGIVLTAIPGKSAGAGATVRLADGRLVVAGYQQTSAGVAGATIVLARYHANGTLDASFGSGGIRSTTLFTAGSDFPGVNLVAVPGAKLLVGPHNGYARVARISADGALDPGFGSGGTIKPKIRDESLVVQSDGKFLVAGYGPVAGGLGIVVQRFFG